MEHEILPLSMEGDRHTVGSDLEDDSDYEEDDNFNNPDLVDIGYDVNNEKLLISCLKSNQCAVCLYLTISMISLSCVVAVIVVGIFVLSPYQKVSHFRSASCEPISLTWESDDRGCTCGKRCHSEYPCVKINVHLYSTLKDNNSTVSVDVVMTEDESMLQHQVINL